MTSRCVRRALLTPLRHKPWRIYFDNLAQKYLRALLRCIRHFYLIRWCGFNWVAHGGWFHVNSAGLAGSHEQSFISAPCMWKRWEQGHQRELVVAVTLAICVSPILPKSATQLIAPNEFCDISWRWLMSISRLWVPAWVGFETELIVVIPVFHVFWLID